MSILNPIILGEERDHDTSLPSLQKKGKKQEENKTKESGEKIKKIYSNVDKLKIKMQDCLK